MVGQEILAGNQMQVGDLVEWSYDSNELGYHDSIALVIKLEDGRLWNLAPPYTEMIEVLLGTGDVESHWSSAWKVVK